MGLNNPFFKEHINSIFGNQRAKELGKKIVNLDPKERELTIIDELGLAINDLGFPYILPFCFKDEFKNRTSHYIIFITKNYKGYEIMKKIMAKYSSELNQGVPTFEYCPASPKQPFLFSFNRPLDDLSEMLLDEFKGQSITMKEIFRQHNVGKPFIEKNYKDVLYRMERKRLIRAKPPWTDRPKNTFGNDVLVIFPKK
jgi:hypothetical protein